MKQTYRNRCVIASADGPLALTIPVEKSSEGKCAMKDIRVSEHGNWRHVHRNAFVAAYKQNALSSIIILTSSMPFLTENMSSFTISIWNSLSGCASR